LGIPSRSSAAKICQSSASYDNADTDRSRDEQRDHQTHEQLSIGHLTLEEKRRRLTVEENRRRPVRLKRGEEEAADPLRTRKPKNATRGRRYETPTGGE
jgi:hypothetical protein